MVIDLAGTSIAAVLQNVNLFVATTRIAGVERETGQSLSLGNSRKRKELQSIINPVHLAGLKAIKTELFRMCRSHGTRIEILGAWGVPRGPLSDRLTERLRGMAARWETLTDALAAHWPQLVRDWIKENPEYASDISRLAYSAEEVRKKTKFVFASYVLLPEQIEACALDDEFDTLPEQACREFAVQIRDTYDDIGTPKWETKSYQAHAARALLSAISHKANGLGFLHPHIAGIPTVLDLVLAELPAAGSIAGLEAIGLRHVLDRLCNTRLLLSEGLQMPGNSSKTAPANSSDPSNPKTGNYDW